MSWEVPSMPSKRLSFNSTLFRKNLNRFWPLWGGVTLLGSLLPLTLLMTLLNPYFLGDVTKTDMIRVFYTVAAGVLPVLTLLYAVLVGMAVWSWLYAARSVGFMHTLPLNRESIFLTCAASGFAMLLIPYAIVGLLTCLVLACFGLLPLLAAVQTAAAVIGYTVFYFGTATFAAMVTSNLLALPVFYFIGHFFAVIFQTLLGWFASSLIFGYSFSGDLSLTFLSPTVAFYRYMEINTTHLEDGTWETTFHGMWIIWAYALVGIVLLALAYWLYRLRHSESAGEVVAYRALKPIFRYGVALCSALTLGMVLYELLWDNTFSTGLYSDVVPMTAFMIFAGVIGYYAASMLLAKSHKVFKGSGRGVAIVAVLVVVLCAGVYFDVPGLGRRVPDAADVRRAYVQIDGRALSLEAGDPRIEEVIALQRCLLDSEDQVRAFSRQGHWSYGPIDATTTVYYLDIDYYLRNGGTLCRSYHIPLYLDRWQGAPDSYEGRIDRLMNSPQAALERVTGPENGTLTHLSVWTDNGGTDTDGPVKETIYAALLEDAQAGRIPGLRPFQSQFESMMTNRPVGHMELEFRYTYTNERTGEELTDYLSKDVTINTSMTSTLQALLDTGVLSPAEAKELPTGVLNGLTIPEEAPDVEWYPNEGIPLPK